METDNQLEKVRQVIQHYFDATENANIRSLYKAFIPDVKIFYIDDEKKLAYRDLEEMESLIIEHHGKAERKNSLIDLEVEQNIARATTRADYPGFYFKDYMSLMKIQDRWKIVGKVTVTVPKPN